VSIGTAGTGAGQLLAGGDVNIAAVTNEVKTSVQNDPSSKLYDKQVHENQTVLGAVVRSSGDLVVSAGKNAGNLTLSGSTLSGDGTIMLSAGNDIKIASAAESHLSDTATHRESKSLLKSSSSSAADYNSSTLVVGSTVSGGNVVIDSGRDTAVAGSTVVADKDIAIAAGRDLTIASAESTSSGHSSSSSKQAGVMGASIGKVKTTQESTHEEVTQVGSQIASLGGNVSLSANNQYTQTASQVIAPEGDIAIRARDVLVNAATDSSHGTEHDTYSKTSIGVSVSVPLVEQLQAIGNMRKAGDDVGDGRMKALATLNMGFNAIDAASTAKTMATQGKFNGVGVSVSLGSSKSESEVERSTQTAVGSTIAAGGSVSIVAAGGGADSNIKAIGSNITGNKDVLLSAENSVDLLAAQNTSSQHSTNDSSGGSIGVGFTVGGQQNGFSINVGLNKASGNADGEELTHTNTHVAGGGTVKVVSGGDTTLQGATIEGQTVQAQVGGDLLVESLQDRSTFDSKQQSAGLNASLCIPPFCTGASSLSGNIGKSKANGDYLSVVEQSGIKTGDGGFDVTVRGNTDLKGGLLASRDFAIADGRNSLNTGTLTTSDLVNKSTADASSSGLSLSTKMFDGKYEAGKALIGNSLNHAGQDAASTGTTSSAVSAGLVTIRDEAKQLELTQQTSSQAVAGLSRDTENTNQVAQQYDAAGMQKEVDTIRASQQAIFQETTKFTDESYRRMFIDKAEIYLILTDADGKPIPDKDGKPQARRLTDAEKLNLQKDSVDGKIHIANNGIFNDQTAASKYAEQHSSAAGPQYFIHFPEAGSVVSELMIAGYQKLLEGDTLGLTNATQQVKDMMKLYGETGLHLDAHSRGSMTVGNAMQSLSTEQNSSGILSNTTMTFYGPAFNAQEADGLLGQLQLRDKKDPAVQASYELKLQNHVADIVGGANGHNPGTGGVIPEGSSAFVEKLKVMFGDVTVHNCYGRGSADCRKYWKDSPSTVPESRPISSLNKDKGNHGK
jgi:filamentous hemagglutinin